MRYHGYHLRGYAAGGFGTIITLDLVFDYPLKPIRFIVAGSVAVAEPKGDAA